MNPFFSVSVRLSVFVSVSVSAPLPHRLTSLSGSGTESVSRSQELSVLDPRPGIPSSGRLRLQSGSGTGLETWPSPLISF